MEENKPLDKKHFWDLGFTAIKQLETDQGILASSRQEIYGCIFGRDSLITALKLLYIYKKSKNQELLPLVRKILINLFLLQGKTVNIESGEQPGKVIHEFRPSGHEHLTKRSFKPWYVYEDKVMRNYDSIDSTPLLLIATYRYWQITHDEAFLQQALPPVQSALKWIFDFGDMNGDGFIDYELSNARNSGGLVTQNWMDSEDSVFHETGEELAYPLAPVEVQGYVYMALRLWANYFYHNDLEYSKFLNQKASELKENFNKTFYTQDPEGNFYLASKLDGRGRLLRSVRSTMGHVLWSSLNYDDDGFLDSILEKKYVPEIVKRLLMDDMFEPNAGIRTLSRYSTKFTPNSYHNGTIWPHDNTLIAEGFEIHGFHKEAAMVRTAILRAIDHYKTPIELYGFDQHKFFDYSSENGKQACKVQAWSAAAILDAAVT